MDLMTIIEVIQPINIIQELVERKGIPIDDQYEDYDLLNKAVKLERHDVVKYLLSKSCRVNKPVNIKKPADSPLHHAVKLKNFDLVWTLLEYKASVEILNAQGDSPLHLAFVHEQLTIVDILLEYIKQNAIYKNWTNKQGLSHLHIASTRENVEIIEKFLENGASITDSIVEDSRMWEGFTALHFAVQYKSVKAVNILSNALTRLNIKEEKYIKRSCSQLVQTDIQKSLLIADLISDQYAQPQTYQRYGCNTGMLYFDMALMRKDTETVEKFIANGIAVDKYTKGDSRVRSPYPLHLAVDSNSNENVELLLKHNADIANSDISTGMTPLHLALYNEEQGEENTIVDTLYSAVKGTRDPRNHIDNNGLSYLHIAVTRNDLETVQNYLDAGNSVNSQVQYDKGKFYHFSPLHFAVLYENKEMAKLLIDQDANVNLNDDNEHGTPLHMAIATGNVDLMELLLRNGADVKAMRSQRNETVLHVLIDHIRICEETEETQQESLISYIERFVKMGCDINAQDHLGRTALYIYAKYCNKTSIKVSWILQFLKCGADVNLESHQACTPLELFYNACKKKSTGDHRQILMLLYDHLQKLQALNMKSHSKNIEYCNKYLERMKLDVENDEDSKVKLNQEIENLKNTRISDCVEPSSLYDLLDSNPNFTTINFKVSWLENIMNDKDFKSNFPSYGYLIKLQCRELYKYKGIKVSEKNC